MNPFQYVGQYGVYHDGETGFDFMQNRYYNSDISRFITPDTFPGLLVKPISQNAYLYANGDPINYINPDGHFFWGGLWNGIKSFGRAVVRTFKSVVKSVYNGVKSVCRWVKSTWRDLKANGKKVLNGIRSTYQSYKQSAINYAKQKAEEARQAAIRAAEEARIRWENTKKMILQVKEETKKITQSVIDQVSKAVKEEFQQTKEMVKADLATLAQSANKFLASPTGQVVKDLGKIVGGAVEMAVAVSPLVAIFGGKLLSDGYKNFSEGLNTKTGKVLIATGKVIGGVAEAVAGVAVGIAGVVTGVGALEGIIGGGLLATHGLSTAYSGLMDFNYIYTNQTEKVGTVNPFKDIAKSVLGDEAGEKLSLGMDIVSIFVGGGGIAKGVGKVGRIADVVDKTMEEAGKSVNFMEGIKNFPLFPVGQRVSALPDTLSSSAWYTVGDGLNDARNFFNRMMGKGDEAGDVGKIPTEGNSSAEELTKIDDYIDLTAHRKDHILNRHRAGAGIPEKTEFPASWSDGRILHQVSDVATDPNSIRGVGKWDSPYAIGVREGIEIRVDFYPLNHPKYSGQISTAYPLNVPPNPPKP